MEHFGPASSPTESIWTTTEAATLGTELGRTMFSIEWQTESPVDVGHSSTFAGVAHPYVADESSGPIDFSSSPRWMRA